MDVEDHTLPMDQTDKPELVDEPKLQHELTAEPEAQAEETPEAKPEQLRGPDGKFAKEEGDKPADEAAVAPPATEPDNVPVRALQDERRKRQELEQQIEAMRQQFERQKPQEQAPPQFWDDPDKAIEARVNQAAEMAVQRFQQQQTMERISASEAAAKGKYADYGDAFHAFQQAGQTNPTLVQQMVNSPDPAEFAYRTGKRSMDLEKVGSIDELLKAERVKWEAEVKAAAPTPTFPVSTASDGSVAARGGPIWSGPVQDRDILPMG